MTKEELSKIRQRAANATRWPWRFVLMEHTGRMLIYDRDGMVVAEAYDDANWRVITQAPADIHALVAEVDQLMARVNGYEKILRDLDSQKFG